MDHGLVLWFVPNMQSQKSGHGGGLTFEELEAAKLHLFQYVQQQDFPGELCTVSQGRALPEGSPLHKFFPLLDEGGLIQGDGQASVHWTPLWFTTSNHLS